MGGAKRQLEKMEQYESIAKEVLVQLKYIEECPICGYFRTDYLKLEKDDWAKITAYFKKHFSSIEDKIDFKEFHAAIDNLIESANLDTINEHMKECH